MGDSLMQDISQATYERTLSKLREQATPVTVFTRGSHGETTGIDLTATGMAQSMQDLQLMRQAASLAKAKGVDAAKAEPAPAAAPAPQDSAARVQAEKAATFTPSAIKFGN